MFYKLISNSYLLLLLLLFVFVFVFVFVFLLLFLLLFLFLFPFPFPFSFSFSFSFAFSSSISSSFSFSLSYWYFYCSEHISIYSVLTLYMEGAGFKILSICLYVLYCQCRQSKAPSPKMWTIVHPYATLTPLSP